MKYINVYKVFLHFSSVTLDTLTVVLLYSYFYHSDFEWKVCGWLFDPGIASPLTTQREGPCNCYFRKELKRDSLRYKCQVLNSPRKGFVWTFMCQNWFALHGIIFTCMRYLWCEVECLRSEKKLTLREKPMIYNDKKH